MSFGRTVRGLLGPLERPISEAYRSTFVDLAAFAAQIARWSNPVRILELGCGEGAMAERLAGAFPEAHITGIDITPRVGRMFRGDARRITFRQQTIRQLAESEPGAFDLVVACDVLHHVPWEIHEDILADAGRSLKAGGRLVVKDWERSATPIHLLCYAADRYITGDRIRYKSEGELAGSLERVFGRGCVRASARIPPWANNVAFLVQV